MPDMKRKNPYQRLLEDFQLFANSVKYPRRLSMFWFSRPDLIAGKSWSLREVYERTQAANTLGYDVVIVADKDGLTIQYRKRPDRPPYQIDF